MISALIVFVALLLLGTVYRVHAACSPFTTRGRRRGIYWVRGWWRGEQAQNRDG